MATLPFTDVHAALTECMAKHPPSGHDLRMHPDANAMSGLWAWMLCEHLDSVEISNIKASVLEALARWSCVEVKTALLEGRA